ncbi:MAG: DUF3601 domain-containing protein [Caldilineaceae bacterium]
MAEEMYGPEQSGHWHSIAAPNHSKQYHFLHTGKWYRVIARFTDFDGDCHEAGERWLFLGCSYQPYDDGVSWFVSLDGIQEWHIRLQQRIGAQSAILDNLSTYIVEEG